LEDLSKAYKAAAPGSREHTRLGDDVRRFKVLQKEAEDHLKKSRRRRAAEIESLEEQLEKPGTTKDHDALKARLAQYKAEEMAHGVSPHTFLHPETAKKCVDEPNLDALCERATGDAKQGYAILKSLGAPPAFLHRLLRMPALLASVVTRQDGRDIMAMSEDELAEWEEDWMLTDIDEHTDSESYSLADSDDVDDDWLSSDGNASDFETSEEAPLHEDGLDWSTHALQATANAQPNAVLGEQSRRVTLIRTVWDSKEIEILTDVLKNDPKLGASWWTTEDFTGTHVYEKIKNALKDQGYDRNRKAISGKVRSLAQKLRFDK
jgi:hypothetical protein